MRILACFKIVRDLENVIDSDWKSAKDAGFRIDYTKKLINDAKQYSVNVYRYQFNKLLQTNAVYKSIDESVWLLKPQYYDNNTGVATEEKEVRECSIQIL